MASCIIRFLLVSKEKAKTSLSPDGLPARLCWGVWAPCPRPTAALLTLCLARAPSNATSFSRQCPRPRPLTAPWRSRPAQQSCVTPAARCARARCCGSRTSISTSSALSAKVSERLWPVPWLQWPQGQPGPQPRFRAHSVSPEIWGLRKSPESRIFTQQCDRFSVACVTYGGDRGIWPSGEGQDRGQVPKSVLVQLHAASPDSGPVATAG